MFTLVQSTSKYTKVNTRNIMMYNRPIHNVKITKLTYVMHIRYLNEDYSNKTH